MTVSIVILVLSFAAIQCTLPVGSGLDEFHRVVRALGDSILEEIGWVCGFYLTILLGFFVVSVTGQIRGTGDRAWQTSRTLGVFSTLIIACTFPAIVLSSVASVGEADKAAKMLVVIPAYTALILLSITLGNYAVNDPRVQLKLARTKLSKAQVNLEIFRSRSRFAAWKVFLLPPLALSFVLASLTMVFYHPVSFSAALGIYAFYAVIGGFCAVTNFHTVISWMMKTSVWDKLLALVLLLFYLAALAAIGVGLAYVSAPLVGITCSLTGLLPTFAIFLSRKKETSWTRDWNPRAAVANYIYRKSEVEKRWAELQIEHIECERAGT
ncbi:hypothetical protein M2368_003531 [Arthrobacter sp. JUb119]|uniref:hypothetical protein n=1 Tax=Arthrobacter sp. JUb115 TaxID=2485108 RepID=UPI0010616AA4|nr:hypothetical protein [Arthrobacter sp. JUb115]MCS3494499.1 hypothetical protein [Arthrobacter sp. JUb119]